MDKLQKKLMDHEGLRLLPYKCSADKISIGYGRNIEDNGISHDEALYLLNNDIDRCKKELSHFSWYLNQPQVIKDALVNMNFNLGLTKVLRFRKMIQALDIKDYKTAAIEALDSKWAKQVPSRAKDIANMIREEE
jgi:lysozyme